MIFPEYLLQAWGWGPSSLRELADLIESAIWATSAISWYQSLWLDPFRLVYEGVLGSPDESSCPAQLFLKRHLRCGSPPCGTSEQSGPRFMACFYERIMPMAI